MHTYCYICMHIYIYMYVYVYISSYTQVTIGEVQGQGVQIDKRMQTYCHIRMHVYVYISSYTQVTIGEVQGQGVRIASRCLWDVETDNHASAYYTNPHCELQLSKNVLQLAH
jgi:hypothetical protein